MRILRSDSALPSRHAPDPARVSPGKNRPGFALGLALVFVLAIGALATSAIVLSSNASLMAKAVDRQRELKYAAEDALNIGKSRLNQDPLVMPALGDTLIVNNATVYAADNTPLPNVKVNVWVGNTGSTTGQFGVFASVVAQAIDNRGTGFVRRLELVQESFAKFAYWSNLESNNGTTIYFNNGDAIFGPVFSNDIIHIGSGGASFHDLVSTAQTISGIPYGTFSKGYLQNQKTIALPSTAVLAKLSGYAAAGGMSFTPPTTGDETTVRQRIEFVATDIAGTGDSLAANDGFFRVYTANTLWAAGGASWLRGDAPSSWSTQANVMMCGDWHPMYNTATGANYPDLKFFPVSVHSQTWFKSMDSTYWVHNGMTATNAKNAASTESALSTASILGHASSQCYLGGDPHLVAIDRNGATGYAAATYQKGGDDTTFTPVGKYGSWSQYSTTPDPTVTAKRPADAKYLFPIYRGLNPNTKGVVYFAGTVGVSGTVNGRITLYAHSGTIVILDDTRYAEDPALGVCSDILGLIADNNVVVADNAINTPQQVSGATYTKLDPTPDLYIHSVIMALNTAFEVENYSSGPNAALLCGVGPALNVGRGCLYLTGGIIQKERGAVGLSTGEGYIKRYSYDRCAATNPPPYFPTTGRLTDNRYFEINPIGFNAASLFLSLTPGP
jgi:hypothetical protein